MDCQYSSDDTQTYQTVPALEPETDYPGAQKRYLTIGQHRVHKYIGPPQVAKAEPDEHEDAIRRARARLQQKMAADRYSNKDI